MGPYQVEQNNASAIPFGPFLDWTDGKTPVTGIVIASGDVQIWKLGSTFPVSVSTDATMTHSNKGMYSLSLANSDYNVPGWTRIECMLTGVALPVWESVQVLPTTSYNNWIKSGEIQATADSADWDATERSQIRYRLGIDGTESAPSTNTDTNFGAMKLSSLFINQNQTAAPAVHILTSSTLSGVLHLENTSTGPGVLLQSNSALPTIKTLNNGNGASAQIEANSGYGLYITAAGSNPSVYIDNQDTGSAIKLQAIDAAPTIDIDNSGGGSCIDIDGNSTSASPTIAINNANSTTMSIASTGGRALSVTSQGSNAVYLYTQANAATVYVSADAGGVATRCLHMYSEGSAETVRIEDADAGDAVGLYGNVYGVDITGVTAAVNITGTTKGINISATSNSAVSMASAGTQPVLYINNSSTGKGVAINAGSSSALELINAGNATIYVENTGGGVSSRAVYLYTESAAETVRIQDSDSGSALALAAAATNPTIKVEGNSYPINVANTTNDIVYLANKNIDYVDYKLQNNPHLGLTGYVMSATSTSVGGSFYPTPFASSFDGASFTVINGSGLGQTRRITAYNPVGQQFTTSPAFTTIPNSGDIFRINYTYDGLVNSALKILSDVQTWSGVPVSISPTTQKPETDAYSIKDNVNTATNLINLNTFVSGEVVNLGSDITTMRGADSDTLKTLSDQIDGLSTSAAPQLLVNTTIATLASQTSFTLTAGSADNDTYNGAIIVITDQSTSTQKAVGLISDYVGSSKTITLSSDPGIFTMAVGDTVDILAAIGSAPTVTQIRQEMDANSTRLAAIYDDTNELQANQGNWATAVGFSTHSAADVRNEMDANSSKLAGINEVVRIVSGDVENLDGAAMRGTDGAYTGTPPTVVAIRSEIDSNSTKLINIDSVLRIISGDVENLDGAAMRGTDGAYVGTPPTAAAIRNEMDNNSVKLSSINSGTNNLLNGGAGLTGIPWTQVMHDGVHSGVWDVLYNKRYNELTAVTDANDSIANMMKFMHMLSRNKMTQTATTSTLRDDADSATVATSAISTGVIFTRGEWS